MDQTRLGRRLLGAGLIAGALVLPGCVFDDIHEELVTINANMKVTQDILLDANATLDDVQVQLDEVQRTNELLVELQAGLGTDGMAATRTENRHSLIATMESIDRSLAQMDRHLSSLRETIMSIDNTIPFLRFSAGEDEEEDAEAGGVAEGEVEGAPMGKGQQFLDDPDPETTSAGAAEDAPLEEPE